jgi:hypothetical protein
MGQEDRKAAVRSAQEQAQRQAQAIRNFVKMEAHKITENPNLNGRAQQSSEGLSGVDMLID